MPARACLAPQGELYFPIGDTWHITAFDRVQIRVYSIAFNFGCIRALAFSHILARALHSLTGMPRRVHTSSGRQALVTPCNHIPRGRRRRRSRWRHMRRIIRRLHTRHIRTRGLRRPSGCSRTSSRSACLAGLAMLLAGAWRGLQRLSMQSCRLCASTKTHPPQSLEYCTAGSDRGD